MAFSQDAIADVRVAADGPDLFVAWSSTAAEGATFQVYVDRRLAWSGTARSCHVPTPAGARGRNTWVEVGVVDPGDRARDFAASLTAPGNRTERATLTWSGGTYLDPTGRDDVGGFRVFQGTSPGGPADTSAAVGFVPAYPGGWVNDGFGKGGFGAAGFGRAATTYRWQSGPLAAGTWQFLVVPVDRAGNPRGGAMATGVAINSAPRPPAADARGRRLTAADSGLGDRRFVLRWLPSPA